MLSLVQVVKRMDKLRKVIDRELFQEQHESFLVIPSGIGARQAVLPMIRLIFKVLWNVPVDTLENWVACSGVWILKGANMKKRPVSARGLSTVRVRTVFENLNHRLSVPEGRLNLLSRSLLWASAYFQSFRFSWLISSILYFLCKASSLVNFDVD